MPDITCPNKHTFWYNGAMGDGLVYNCPLCMAEGRKPCQFELPRQMQTKPPVVVDTYGIPDSPFAGAPMIIELPGQEQPQADTVTARDLAEEMGVDLRSLLGKLRAVDPSLTSGDAAVPRALADTMRVKHTAEPVPAGAG